MVRGVMEGGKGASKASGHGEEGPATGRRATCFRAKRGMCRGDEVDRSPQRDRLETTPSEMRNNDDTATIGLYRLHARSLCFERKGGHV